MAVINIGDINFGVGANTSGLRQAMSDIRNFSNTVIGATAQIAAAAQSVTQFTNSVNQAKAATQSATPVVRGFNDVMRDISRAAALVTGPLSGVAFRITLLSELISKGALSTALFVSGMAGAAYGLFKLGEAAVATEMHLTHIRNSLFALSGSTVQTRLDMNFLMDTADKFGLKFTEVAGAFAKLDMAARGTRLQGEGVREIFTQIMAVAGNLNQSQETLAGTLNFVERMLSMGVVQWRNLREAAREIPNIMNLLSEAIGVKGPIAIEKFLKLGTTMSDVLLPKIIAAMVRAYNVDVAARVDNVTAAHNRLANAELRFINAYDATVGASEGARRSYETLSRALDAVSRNMETVIKVAVPIAGALAGIGAAYIISGLLAVASAVKNITIAVGALNVALIANPAGLLLKVVAAAAAAGAAYYYFGDAFKTQTDHLITGKVAVDEYVRSWDKMKTGFSSDTVMMIAKQKDSIAALTAELQGAEDRMKDAQKAFDDLSAKKDVPALGGLVLGQRAATLDELSAEKTKVNEAVAAYQKYKSALADAYSALGDLNRVMKEQKDVESKVAGIPGGENDALMRMKNAAERLKTALEGVTDEWTAMQAGNFAAQQAVATDKLNKEIERMRDNLMQAGFTWDRTKESFTDPAIDSMFHAWAAFSKSVQDIKLFDKNFVQGWQVAEEALQTLAQKGIGGIIDALNKGKLTWKSFSDIAISVITDIEKKIIELSVVNPILMALFGGGPTGKPIPVFSPFGGGTQPGGIIGSLFQSLFTPSGAPGATFGAKGIGSAHSGTPITTYRQVNPAAFLGAPRLHGGLYADEFPAILQRGESVIPRGVTPGGAPVTINISHPTGTEAEVRKATTGAGDMYSVIISQVQRAFGEGRFDQVGGARFGMRPASIRR